MNLTLNRFTSFTGPVGLRAAPRPAVVAASWLLPTTRALQTIDKGATWVVPHAQGATVTCVRGSLWITQDGDPKDTVIEAGDSFTSDRASRMLVYGLEASSASVG